MLQALDSCMSQLLGQQGCSPRQRLSRSLLGHGHSSLSAGVRKEAARQRRQNRAREGPASNACPPSSGLCNTARALLVQHCNSKTLPARADTEVLWWVVTAQPNHALVISSAPPSRTYSTPTTETDCVTMSVKTFFY